MEKFDSPYHNHAIRVLLSWQIADTKRKAQMVAMPQIVHPNNEASKYLKL